MSLPKGELGDSEVGIVGTTLLSGVVVGLRGVVSTEVGTMVFDVGTSVVGTPTEGFCVGALMGWLEGRIFRVSGSVGLGVGLFSAGGVKPGSPQQGIVVL